MPFVQEQNTEMFKKKLPFYRKLGWKIFFVLLGIVIVVAISFVAYIFATGSKVFQNGLGGGGSLFRTITGQKEELKGQKEDRINIVFSGMGGQNHPGGMLTDSIIFLSYKPSTNQLSMLSIPRDLLVPISGHNQDKINSAFADGYNDYSRKNCNSKNAASCRSKALIEGAKLMNQTVSNVLNQPVGYYVSADFSGFEKMIDQLGGIDVNVGKAISDPTFPADDMIHYAPFKITAGQHHMDGALALKYARSRHTTSDFDRAKRQQIIIEAAKDKALKLGFLSNPKNIIDMISNLGDSLKTDMTPNELRTFVDLIKSIPSDKITTQVLDDGPDGQLVSYNDGAFYLKPKTGNFKEIQNYVRNIFALTVSEKAKIEVQNGSKTAGVGTKAAAIIVEDGYNVVSTITATTKTSKTVIYDYTNGKKPETIKYLKNKFNATVTVKTIANPTVDISVIVGDDYATNITISKANGVSTKSQD